MQRFHSSSSSGLLAMPLAGDSSSSDDSNSDEEGVVSHAQSSTSDSSDMDALAISVDDESDGNELHLQAAKRPRKNIQTTMDVVKRNTVKNAPKKTETPKVSSGNRKSSDGRANTLPQSQEKKLFGKMGVPLKGQSQKMAFASPRTGNKQLYCICRSEDDGTRFMVGCDGCEEWFHGSCVGVTQEMALASRIYFCEKCRISNSSDQKPGTRKARTPPPRSLTGGMAVTSDSSSGCASSSSCDSSSSSDEAVRASNAKGMKRNIMKVISEVSNGLVNGKSANRKRSRVDIKDTKMPSKRTKMEGRKVSGGWEVEEGLPVRRYGMGKGGGKGGKVFSHPKDNSLSGDEDELDLLDLCPVCDGKCTCNNSSNQTSAPATPSVSAPKGRRGGSNVAHFEDDDDEEVLTEKKRPKSKPKGWTVEPTRTKSNGNTMEPRKSGSIELFDNESRKPLAKKNNAAPVSARGLDAKKKSAPIPTRRENASTKANVDQKHENQKKSNPSRKNSGSGRNANRSANMPVQRKEELELEDGMEYLIDIEGDEDEEVVAVDSIAAVAAARAAKKSDGREDRRFGGSKRRSKRKDSGDGQVILMFEPPHGMVVVGGESHSDSDEELSDLVIDSDSEEEAVRIGQRAGLLLVDDDTGHELDEEDFHEKANTTGAEDSDQYGDSDDESEEFPDEDEIVESFIARQVYGLSWSDEEDEDEELDHMISAEGEESEEGGKSSYEANSELPSPMQIDATGQTKQANGVTRFDDGMEEDVGVVVNREDVEAIATSVASDGTNQNLRRQSLSNTTADRGAMAGTIVKAENTQPSASQTQQQSFSFDIKKTQLGPNGEIITTTKNLTFSLQPKSGANGAKPPSKRSQKKDAPDANRPRDKVPESSGLGKFVIPLATTKPLLATPSTTATVPQPAAPSLPPPPPPAITPPFGPNFFSAFLPGLMNAAHGSPLTTQNWGQTGTAAGKGKLSSQVNGNGAKGAGSGTDTKKVTDENALSAMSNLLNPFLNPFAAGLTAMAGNPQMNGSGGNNATGGKKDVTKNGPTKGTPGLPVPPLSNAQNPDAYQAYVMAATMAHMHNVQQVLFAAAMAQQQQQAAGSKSGKDKGKAAGDDKSKDLNNPAIQPFLEIQKQLEEMAKNGGTIPPFIPPFPFSPGDPSKASAEDPGMAAFAATIAAFGAGMVGVPAPVEAPATEVSATKSSAQTSDTSSAQGTASQEGSKRTKGETNNSRRAFPGSSREFPYVYLRKRKMQEEPEPNISIDEFVDTEALEEDRENDADENISEEERQSSPQPTGSVSADRKPTRTPNRAASVAAETPSPAFTRWQRIPIGTFRRSRRPSGGWNRELAAAIRAAIAENGQPENMHATLLDSPLSLITTGQSAEANSDSPGISVKEESSAGNRRSSVLPNGSRKEKRQRLELLDDDIDEVDFPNGLQSPLLGPMRSSPSLRPVGFGFVPRPGANQSSGPSLRRSSISISSLNSGAITPSSTVFTFPEKFAASSDWMPVVLLGDPAQKFNSDGFVELDLDGGFEKPAQKSADDENGDGDDILHLDPETQEIQIEVQVEEIGSGKSSSISTTLNDGLEMAESSSSGEGARSATAAMLEHVAMVAAAAAAAQVASAAANMVNSQENNTGNSDTDDAAAEQVTTDGLSADVKLEIARILSGDIASLDVAKGISSSRTTVV
ncbi:hypothetical protein BJ742DRAFT_515933 [Cladochytrium replicatum]|nr:hypothetical protein BJ742DRAFT_515933 [Cladochytrium replicatum]